MALNKKGQKFDGTSNSFWMSTYHAWKHSDSIEFTSFCRNSKTLTKTWLPQRVI